VYYPDGRLARQRRVRIDVVDDEKVEPAVAVVVERGAEGRVLDVVPSGADAQG
jgi:hypothetical protein